VDVVGIHQRHCVAQGLPGEAGVRTAKQTV